MGLVYAWKELNMKEIIGKLKDIMIEAAERDGNHELAKKLKQLRKEEKEVNKVTQKEL